MKIGFGVKAAGLFDARPQQTQRAEFCQRQELIGIGGKPRIDHAPRILERDAGALQRAQIGDGGRQHERQFLHFRSAGIMDHPSVGDRERALESHRREAFDRAGDRGHDLRPGIGTGSPDRAGADRVEAETDIAGRGVKAFALHIFGDVDRGHARLRADLKLDRNAGIEENAVENLLDRFRPIGARPKPWAPLAPANTSVKPGGAVLEIVQRLRIGLRSIRMIDPLHDLPGRGRGAAGDRRGVCARADRSVRSSARRRSCRPASRTARLSARHRPACASRHRSPARKSAASRSSSVADVIRQVAPGDAVIAGWGGNCHVATAKPNGCFGSSVRRSGVRILVAGRATARSRRWTARPAPPRRCVPR